MCTLGFEGLHADGGDTVKVQEEQNHVGEHIGQKTGTCGQVEGVRDLEMKQLQSQVCG